MRWNDRGSNVLLEGARRLHAGRPAGRRGRRRPGARSRLRALVNGEVAQDDSTANLLFPFGLLVADLSRFMTLEPGDIILTGTPAGSRPVEPGDVVEVELHRALVGAQPDRRGRRADRRLRRPAAGLARHARGRARRQRAAAGDALARAQRRRSRTVSTATLSVQIARRGVRNTFVARAARRRGPTCACSATPTRCATCRCARTCATPTPPS